MRALVLLRPDEPAQGDEMPDAHQSIGDGFGVEAPDAAFVHRLAQAANVALADPMIVGIERLRRDTFGLLDDAINPPMAGDESEESLEPTFLNFQAMRGSRNGRAHLCAQAMADILDQFGEDLAFTMEVDII